MSKNKCISMSVFVMFMILSINSSSAQTSPGDEDIISKWSYSVDDDITALTAGKMNNNSVVIIASAKNLYILNKDGNLTEQYAIQTPGKIYAITIGNIDEDNESEILLGVGWMETEEIDLNKAYPPPDGIPEEEDLLYKVLKNRGSFYVIDEGKINKWDEVDQWVRSIIVSDINGDGKDEVIIVSGGYLNNYFKRYTDMVYRHKYCWLEWDTTYADYDTEAECTCDGCFWDNLTGNCYQNVTVEECDWNETTAKGWNLSESSLVDGSIIIFDKSGDLLLKSNMTVSKTFWSADVSNLYHDRDEEIIVGSGNKIYIFTDEGNVQASYDVLGDVNNIYISDINNDENDDIIFSFRNSSSGISGIEVINREGREVWAYRMKPESSISAMYMKTLDKDAINEVLLVSDSTLYVIDDRGQLDWSYQFKYNKLILRSIINKIFSVDLDDNGYEDLIIASNRMVYDYEIVGTFIKKQSADKYYVSGKEAYELNRYQDAKSYLERARQLYLESNYLEGVSECDSLLEDIDEKLTGNRGVEADSQYAKALTYYSVRDYESAKEYLQNARDIYSEIGDSDGILRCDSLMATIEEILSKKNATTTTSIVTTTTTLPKESDIISLLSNPITIVGLVAIILILFAIFGRRKAPIPKERRKKEVKRKPKEEPKEKEKLMKRWDAFDEEWKRLEESWNK